MNLVDEEHVVGLEGGEQACQVAGLVEHRTTGGLDTDTEFVGDDIGEGGFTETRRAVEEHMVEGFAAVLGGADEDLEVFHHLLLTGETVESRGSQSALYIFLLRGNGTAVEVVITHCYYFFYKVEATFGSGCKNITFSRHGKIKMLTTTIFYVIAR